MTSILRSARRLSSLRSSNPIRTLRYYSPPASSSADAGGDDSELIDQRQLPADYDPSNFNPADHRGPPSPRVWRLVDEVSTLTLSEVAELSSILAQKIGLKEPPSIAVIMPGAGGMAGRSAGAAAGKEEEKKEEKTVFEIKLESFDAASKIKVIKEVRGFTNLGLKEAKELVEKAPAVIKGGVSKEEGMAIVEKMKAAGAKVVLE